MLAMPLFDLRAIRHLALRSIRVVREGVNVREQACDALCIKHRNVAE